MNTKKKRIVWTLAAVAGGVVLLGQMRIGGNAFAEGGKGDVPGVTSNQIAGGEQKGETPLGTGEIDIAVSRLGLTSSSTPSDNFNYYGASSGIRAFSMASTSCNVGDLPAQWTSGSSGNHPVIAQNVYRYLDGRFEQIGQSWLKHSFCAVSEFTCGACQSTSCGTLGIGCADTYSAGLNDGSGGGPKYQINPLGEGSGGTHVHPYDAPAGATAIRGRLQIHEAEILAGGQFFAEVHYVTHDEPLLNRYNNASWREINLSLTSMSGVFPGQASVHFQEPAIKAWQFVDPGVSVSEVDDSLRGRFHLGYRATDNGDGTWRYNYALHNLNSTRCAGSFSVAVPSGVSVTNTGFHDVDYHSGDGLSGVDRDPTDWSVAVGGGSVSWSTQDHASNPNANAIRWGTLYSFWFDANSPPVDTQASIGLFTPGAQTSLSTHVDGPGPVPICPEDVNGDGIVNVLDLIDLLLCFGLPAVPGCEDEDVNDDGTVDTLDLVDLLLEFGNPCS